MIRFISEDRQAAKTFTDLPLFQRPPTQEEVVFAFLKKHGTISKVQAVDLRILNLHERIRRIRRKHHVEIDNIQKETGTVYAVYELRYRDIFGRMEARRGA